MKGEAEAFAIEAKAKAESEQMCKKADAWKEYEDAAKIEMMLDIIPKVSYRLYSGESRSIYDPVYGVLLNNGKRLKWHANVLLH